MTWPTDRPGDEVRELAIELALPLDVAERVLAYGKQERRAGYDTALTEVEQGVALPATICNRLDAAVQGEREACADVAYGIYDDRMTAGEEETAQGAYDAAVSIQARGPTPALDAALAQARREGMEAALEIARPKGLVLKSAQQIVNEIAAAIRSAAAGEEGK